ncbi:male sterility protein-domain-containing protein [Lanmaoa asiatica]|nr:male sterility protein-domain-containing protein [Lanmaoa asiatica]
MTLLAPSSFHSFPSTSRDAVGHSPSCGACTEHFVHITGEVTNPVFLENFIMEHPMVHSAIMFGHGRYNAGILVELVDAYKIDTSDEKQVEETRNKLHSSYTYGIETTQDLEPREFFNLCADIIAAVLGKRLDDDADLFDYETDSLQATRIRLILFHALQSTAKLDTRKFSGNIVYQYRTIAGLATFATRTARACLRHCTESSQARCLEMTEMVESHSLNYPEHHPSIPPPYDDVVLITGTTGLFGSNLLAQFLQSPRISRVYAFNRRKSRPGSVVERQAALLQASGWDPALARHPKLTFLEANARQSHLGLPQELYEQLLSSVTHIVHNAWLSTHDDNLPPSAFKGSFRMLRNLVDFALSSLLPVPPRLLFISSTDTVRGTSENSLKSTSDREEAGGPVAPEGPAGACNAAGCVLGESKWVGEQILVAAASKTALRPIIIRVGPLCGSPNGRWREEAHFPMIVHLGVTLGALPKVDEPQAVAAMRNSLSTYLHITHPLPVSSLFLLRCISEELRLPLIPLSQWIAKLEAKVYTTPFPSSHSKLDDAALTLLRRIQGAKDPTAIDVPTRMFTHVRFASSTLHDYGVNALGTADVRLWLRHWEELLYKSITTSVHVTNHQKPHNAIVIPINTGQITNTNRNLSFSTSTPLRPAFAARCPCPGTPPPGIVPDGGGTPEGVVDWPLGSAVALRRRGPRRRGSRGRSHRPKPRSSPGPGPTLRRQRHIPIRARTRDRPRRIRRYNRKISRINHCVDRLARRKPEGAERPRITKIQKESASIVSATFNKSAISISRWHLSSLGARCAMLSARFRFTFSGHGHAPPPPSGSRFLLGGSTTPTPTINSDINQKVAKVKAKYEK